MKTEVQYRWRIQWCGRWTTTGYHCSEEHIRHEHPEAQVLPDTRRELQIPETAEEHAEQMRRVDTSKLGGYAPGSAADRLRRAQTSPPIQESQPQQSGA